jgi:hypothetical protein
MGVWECISEDSINQCIGLEKRETTFTFLLNWYLARTNAGYLLSFLPYNYTFTYKINVTHSS